MTTPLPIATQLATQTSGTREVRLGSITGYRGSLRDLGRASGCGATDPGPDGTPGCAPDAGTGSGCAGGAGIGDADRCYAQASLCNAACALGLTSFILDAAVVHHGPAGCAVTAMATGNAKNQLAGALGLDNSRSAYVSTAMTEADTVFGSTERLADIVRETHRRYGSRAVFIGASCVSGVIGEDLDGVAAELADELGIPVAPIHCEGFKTRIWASGFDAAFHAILNHIVRPPRQRRPIVNVINFFGGARKEITEIFARLGVEPLFLISNTDIEQLSRLSESAATVSTCGTLGSYLGNGLQERYGVPYVRSLQPHGIAGFDHWLRGLGEALGKRDEVEEFLAEQRTAYLPRIEAVKQKLAGLRAVVGMGPGFGFNTARALQELGIEVTHSAIWHYDRRYDDGRPPAALEYLVEHSPNDIPLSVSDLQNHELVNILHTLKPDIFFSRHVGSTVWAMKLGIPALCLYDEYAIFGYRGLLTFAHSVLDTVTNRSFTDNLSRRVRLPYTPWWLRQRNDRFFDSGGTASGETGPGGAEPDGTASGGARTATVGPEVPAHA